MATDTRDPGRGIHRTRVYKREGTVRLLPGSMGWFQKSPDPPIIVLRGFRFILNFQSRLT